MATKKKYETLRLGELPPEYQQACKIAAQASATVQEGLLIGAVTKKSLTRAQQKEKLQTALTKAEKQGEVLQISVTDFFHPAVLQTASDLLTK